MLVLTTLMNGLEETGNFIGLGLMSADEKIHNILFDDKKPVYDEKTEKFLSEMVMVQGGLFDVVNNRKKAEPELLANYAVECLWRGLKGDKDEQKKFLSIPDNVFVKAINHILWAVAVTDEKDTMVLISKKSSIKWNIKSSQEYLRENLKILLDEFPDILTEDILFSLNAMEKIVNALDSIDENGVKMYTFDEALTMNSNSVSDEKENTKVKTGNTDAKKSVPSLEQLTKGLDPKVAEEVVTSYNSIMDKITTLLESKQGKPSSATNEVKTLVSEKLKDVQEKIVSSVDAETLNKTPLVEPVK